MSKKALLRSLIVVLLVPCCVFASGTDLSALAHERAFLAGLDSRHLFTKEELFFLYRLVVAVVLGCAMGFSHSFRRNFTSSVSLRTFGAVSLGAAAFSSISVHLFIITSNLQTTPVLQSLSTITTGIGFLCAAVIFKQGVTVKGLSTAATLWASAAVGTACGCNMYGIAIATTLLISLLHRCEKKNETTTGQTSQLDALPD